MYNIIILTLTNEMHEERSKYDDPTPTSVRSYDFWFRVHAVDWTVFTQYLRGGTVPPAYSFRGFASQ